jgi:hypothetical protein
VMSINKQGGNSTDPTTMSTTDVEWETSATAPIIMHWLVACVTLMLFAFTVLGVAIVAIVAAATHERRVLYSCLGIVGAALLAAALVTLLLVLPVHEKLRKAEMLLSGNTSTTQLLAIINPQLAQVTQELQNYANTGVSRNSNEFQQLEYQRNNLLQQQNDALQQKQTLESRLNMFLEASVDTGLDLIYQPFRLFVLTIPLALLCCGIVCIIIGAVADVSHSTSVVLIVVGSVLLPPCLFILITVPCLLACARQIIIAKLQRSIRARMSTNESRVW